MNFSNLPGVIAYAHKHFSAIARLSVGFSFLAIASPADAQVNERSSNWIRGVAHVSLDRNGKSQITFNPRRCRELGPELCEFFRTHEYGHVNLRHLERGVPPAQAEAEADRWAAQNASPNAVQAARNYFLSGNGGSRIHGSPQERARRMNAGAVTTKKTFTTSKRIVRTTAPRKYSATPKRIVRYVSKPSGKFKTTQNKSVIIRSSSSPQRTTVQVKPKSIRYVVKPSPQRSQVIRRTSTGYVPRGDFLNPR